MTQEALLFEAQSHAIQLFDEIERRGLIKAGLMEKDINTSIHALAHEMFNIERYWHKRIVRAGINTLSPYSENPPNLLVKEDDIVFLDFGPIFEKYEADYGRTFVLGNDPHKIKLKNDVLFAFNDGKKYFQENPDITSQQLFQFVKKLGEKYGWEISADFAGHLIGQFPHQKIFADKVHNYIHPDNPNALRQFRRNGKQHHWILEIHFVDREKQIGGFYEDLLTI
jgi:Xaa-Pro dipeptidase